MAGKKKKANGAVIWLVLISIGAGLALSLQPWKAFLDENQKSKQLKMELKSLESEREALMRKAAESKSPAAKEELLRQKGYRRPGEIPIFPKS